MSSRRTRDDLARELGELADLPREQLVERWEQLFNRAVPKGMSCRLMVLAIAYEMQAKHFGRLSAAARRRLRDAARAEAGTNKLKPSPDAASVSVGSRFVREWNGRNHVVDAVDGGFLWQGRTYSSLSAVARAITGHSGPVRVSSDS